MGALFELPLKFRLGRVRNFVMGWSPLLVCGNVASPHWPSDAGSGRGDHPITKNLTRPLVQES